MTTTPRTDSDFAFQLALIRELERENIEQALELEQLRADKARLDWLDGVGRIAKMSDGWNAWTSPWCKNEVIRPDVRAAIDAARERMP